MQLLEGTLLQNGKYRIIRVLGQGGFGITYLAMHTTLQMEVAIKEFFPKDYCNRNETGRLTVATDVHRDTVDKAKNKFRSEARNVRRLNHPGIVRINDVFEENDTIYSVMDFIDGESLSDIVKRRGPLPEHEAIEYIVKVGHALAHVHNHHMTHLDVKPANIMINRHTNEPVLIDFGLSKQYDYQGMATSSVLQAVSHGYSPIELYNAGSVETFSPKSDVYSLGATLYYVLSGMAPPAASSLIDGGLPIPPGIPVKYHHVLQGAMAMSRYDRYETVEDFNNALVNAERNVPPPPGAMPWGEAPTPSNNRTPLIIGLTAAVVVAVFLIICGIVYITGSDDDQRASNTFATEGTYDGEIEPIVEATPVIEETEAPVEVTPAEAAPADMAPADMAAAVEESNVKFNGYAESNGNQYPVKITAKMKKSGGQTTFSSGHYYNINYNVDFPMTVSGDDDHIEFYNAKNQVRIVVDRTGYNSYSGELRTEKNGGSLPLYLDLQ